MSAELAVHALRELVGCMQCGRDIDENLVIRTRGASLFEEPTNPAHYIGVERATGCSRLKHDRDVHRWIIGVCSAANVMSWTRCVLPVCSSPRPTPSARSEFTHAGVRLAHGARDLRLQRGAREVDLRGTPRSDNRRGIVESTRRAAGPLTLAVGRGERP